MLDQGFAGRRGGVVLGGDAFGDEFARLRHRLREFLAGVQLVADRAQDAARRIISTAIRV
jgi:hypothetical protein